MYSFIKEDDKIKKAKGIDQNLVKNMSYKEYKNKKYTFWKDMNET